ncbi:glutathione peroxidase [Flavobacterium psychrophilum]|uniref:glutathione peroxidase n=1 Tax=Flavobacterium psychrophilum TaxID=96345 RepID=UPI0004F84CD5|nr:glutathione peroxidase [Flavobacterium psychrophilum]AIN73733.1 glutathione peroxidase [Flavobacterium psychrophilum FPG3]EKT2069738.1 glutathione peroxidase [Flavobacterium psychrophilum]EKT2071998.1 glutathione peroxidase [Flavobacterium psychrophilum]EKT3965640.1 glutathione peroxidase [Flavobacterium psychrophilum]EKT4491520.1 glutathione peroxidase [Flavobacterium psychrophilum]
MKQLLCLFSLMILMTCKSQETNIKNQSSSEKQKTTKMVRESIYQFKVIDIEGKEFDFSSLKGKKIMIVNTASECGLTPQYKQLQELYTQFKGKNFVIIGFPANNFGHQEPGANVAIATFCSKNYGVTFPMMEKISVKGDDMHILYQFLTQKSKNGLEDNEVQWNFQKYLIDTTGHLVKVIAPTTLPTDNEIVSWIKG